MEVLCWSWGEYHILLHTKPMPSPPHPLHSTPLSTTCRILKNWIHKGGNYRIQTTNKWICMEGIKGMRKINTWEIRPRPIKSWPRGILECERRKHPVGLHNRKRIGKGDPERTSPVTEKKFSSVILGTRKVQGKEQRQCQKLSKRKANIIQNKASLLRKQRTETNSWKELLLDLQN